MYPAKEFEQFYRKHVAALVNFATYRIQSQQDAVEIVNDVFMAIWNKQPPLVLEDTLKSYLYTSVKNRCINFLKKKKLKLVQEEEVRLASTYTADKALLDKEQNKRLEQIMNHLPPKCRQVFAMSRIEELSYKEIANLMDISTKTVEGQMSKALKIFREKLRTE